MIDEAFREYSETVADTKAGMLWQPIQKLMKKAKQNRRTTQMANLSLGDENGQFAGQPMPALDANPQPGMPAQWQTTDAGSYANPRMDGISQSGTWVNGLLGPGSMSSNVPAPPSSEGLDELALRYGLQPNSFAFESVEPNASQEPDDLLDMAWTNWEGFVGDVNFYDFDMPDLTEGFPRQL